MKLYHGTSSENLKKIIKDKALKPRNLVRKSSGNWKKTLSSNPSMVYLTNCYAVSFGFSAAYQLASNNPNWKADDYDNTFCCVLEIDVSPKNLYPDEDCLEQVTRQDNDWVEKFQTLNINDMEGRTKYFRDNQEDYKDYWKASLDNLGTVAHKGPIHINKIKRVSIIKNEIFFISDPTITLTNYRHLGERYKKECEELIWTEEYAQEIIKGKNLKKYSN